MRHVAQKNAPCGIKKCATWYQKMSHVAQKKSHLAPCFFV